MPDTHYEDILRQQIKMNRETWEALLRHGLTEQSQVRLDFSYNAPNSKAAQALRALLLEQTDYDVRVESNGSFLGGKWRVEGRTQETTISPTILMNGLPGWSLRVKRLRVILTDGAHLSESVERE